MTTGMNTRQWALLAVSALALQGTGLAQAQDTAPQADPSLDEKVVVTGSPIARRADELSRIVSTTGRSDLLKNGGADIGDALATIPGISGAGFAQGANRPVVRGFDASRVLVTENGLSAQDVADIGPDHGTPIDMLSSAKIEVLRGAATLRYGSQAIGGVVNVLNTRIPDTAPEILTGEAVGIYSSVSDGLQGAAAIRGGKAVKFHADVYSRRQDDYETPDGKQINSFADASGYAFGLATGDSVGTIGLAISNHSASYGLPSSDTFIEMDNVRLQGRGKWNVNVGALQTLSVEAAGSDYEHSEIEPDGSIGATFLNDEREVRAEAVFGKVGPLSDLAIGLHYNHRDFSALGEAEEFLLPATGEAFAAYVFGQSELSDKLLLEGSLRVEMARREGTPVSDIPTSVDFTPVSGALGLVYAVNETTTLGLTAASAARAPGLTELFARGPHDGPATFEIGDPTLGVERANSLEATARIEDARVSIKAAMWVSLFDGFIYPQLTGNTCDDMGVCIVGPGLDFFEVLWEQDDATFWGFEVEARLNLGDAAGGTWGVLAQADYVDGELDGGEPLPRITPMRYGAGLFLAGETIGAELRVLRVEERDETALFETPTKGYIDLGANATWRAYQGETTAFDVSLVGRNLTDARQRNAVSFVKDAVQQPGRDLRIVGRFTF